MVNRSTRLIVIFFTFLLLVSALFSCSGRDDRISVRQWEVLFDHERDLAAVQGKKGWAPVEIPSTFKVQGAGEGITYFWLRARFTIDDDPAGFYGITMGRVFDTDSVYINSYPVGSMGDDEIGLIRQRRNYVIPRGVLLKGENTLYVNLGVYGNNRGGITSMVRILPRRDYEVVNLISSFFYFHLPLEMMVVASVVSLVLFIFYLWNRKERLYLYTLVAVLLYMLFLVSMYYPVTVLDQSLTRFVQFASYHLFAIALLMIVQSLYSIYVPLYNLVCVPLFLFLAGIVFIFQDSPRLHCIGNGLAIVAEIVLIIVVSVMITRFHRSRKDLFKLIMAAGVSIAGITIAILEIVFSLAGGAYSLLVTSYCAPLFLVLFVIIFAREQMKKNMELEFLYSRLKGQDKADEGLSINEASRQKLDRVIAFIKENYTSDLSREGLAAAVDLNPNYMSGLFKNYTGRKVNEYINHLRIENACDKLADPEVKIIDVALSVGFESLSTFNRAFKKETDRTPHRVPRRSHSVRPVIL